MNLNSPHSHFPMHQSIHDHDHDPFVPNRSSPLSCHFFFDSTQDHTSYYDHHQLYQPPHFMEDEGYGYGSGSSAFETKSRVDTGLKLSLWKKEEHDDEIDQSNYSSSMKWMSSKMRVMQKMKKTDHDHRVVLKTNDHQKVQQPSSSSAETDFSSNASSYNNTNYSPIRVCSDCNTTKTPLWRSGPKGPKSLCNACGIRQRKARRAMAAAANGAAVGSRDQPSSMKIKLSQKGKQSKNGHPSQFKKRCKMAVTDPSPLEGKKKINGFEDFLINSSKNIAFHRVFPDEEKDAAILLMALSSGLVNG